jgi:dihydrofolate reductase
MARPVTAAFLGMSLDGFIAGPKDELDWLERGGPPEDHGFEPFFASIDELLIGRRTWEVVSGLPAWPYRDKQVNVLTHRPADGRHGERFLSGSPAGVLERLGEAGVRRVYVDGGQVVSQYLAAGLLDEFTVTVLPVVIWNGIRLFAGTGPERWLTLEASRVGASGLVQLRYVARG